MIALRIEREKGDAELCNLLEPIGMRCYYQGCSQRSAKGRREGIHTRTQFSVLVYFGPRHTIITIAINFIQSLFLSYFSQRKLQRIKVLGLVIDSDGRSKPRLSSRSFQFMRALEKNEHVEIHQRFSTTRLLNLTNIPCPLSRKRGYNEIKISNVVPH